MMFLIANELNKMCVRDINQNLKKNSFYGYASWDNNDAECNFVLVDKLNKNRYIAGNLYILLIKVADLIEPYYKCEFPIYSSYGILERYKIINGLINIENIEVFNINKNHDDVRNGNIKFIHTMAIKDRCIYIDDITEYYRQLSLNNIKSAFVEYFKLKFEILEIEDVITVSNEFGIFKMTGKDIKYLLNESKKANWSYIEISAED